MATPQDPPIDTVNLTEEEAKKWHGMWDIVITYPNEKETGHEDKDKAMKDREKKRSVFVRRMRRCGLVVVRQLSMDRSFMMLKITAPWKTFEREAARMRVELPLKDDKALTKKGANFSMLQRVGGRSPVELCYAKFDPEMRPLFSTLDGRFFRSMDRQRLIMSILKSARWRGGCGIDINTQIEEGVFSSAFPVHTKRGQDRMASQWLSRPLYKLEQPLNTIRDYFGEKIAFYFAYISFYTQWLVWLAGFGVITFLVAWLEDGDPATLNLDHDINMVYGIYICLWCSLFLEGWKRKQASLAFKFDVTNFHQSQEARPQFKGDRVQGRITPQGLIRFSEMEDISEEELKNIDEYVIWYPTVKRKMRACLSIPIVTTFVACVVIGTFALLAFKTAMENDGVTGGGVIGSVVNAFFIIVMNAVYQWCAVRLTKFENHRTDGEYENALIAKTFLFQFINSYIALFFIAYVKGPPIPTWAQEDSNGNSINNDDLPPEFQEAGKVMGMDIGFCNYASCMMDLFFQLATIVIVKQLLSNFAEIGVPFLTSKFTIFRRLYTVSKEKAEEARQRVSNDKKGSHAEVQVELVELSEEMLDRMPFFEQQANMADPKGTFDEYNELMIQFGYMTLFAAAFPLASLFSLVNNVFEIRVDANKILYASKRPLYQGACNIGTWQMVLKSMSILAVMTNTAIICFTSEALKGKWVDRTKDEYQTCVAECGTDVNLVGTTYAEWETVATASSGWLFAGNVTTALLDGEECMRDCACSGRCLPGTSRFLVFVIAEHVLFFLKFSLDFFIPDVPREIARAMVWKDFMSDKIRHGLQKDKAPKEFQKDSWEGSDAEDEFGFVDDEVQPQKVAPKEEAAGVPL